jgi:uncharacterized protein (TIGR02246 family)
VTTGSAVGAPGAAGSEDAAEIVALEAAALARWCAGDPSGYLEISAPDVGYFEPFLARRLDGLAALTAHYEALRGKIFAARYTMIAPKVVQLGPDARLLSFDFVSFSGQEGAGGEGRRMDWHCSEVYVRTAGGWRIAHTHWSLAPAPAGADAG